MIWPAMPGSGVPIGTAMTIIIVLILIQLRAILKGLLILQIRRSRDRKKKVQRGGSFLCTDQYCTRYMVGSRGKGEYRSATNHVGFRCVKDIKHGNNTTQVIQKAL
ncbi:SUMF1/EgtB/PvdO family nonheme iron enzyme [Mucilaginibacter sp. UC70_90]